MVKSMPRGVIKAMELKKKLINTRSSFLLLLKKTIIPLLISASIFSLVFSWSSLSSLTLLHYQNLHRCYINSLHLISTAMNKNCIFLIFNGILVFLAKTSALVLRPSPSDSDLHKLLNKRIADELQEAAGALSDKHITLDEINFRSAENDVEEKDDDEETKMHEVLQEEVEVVKEETHELQEAMEEVVDEEPNERAVQVSTSIKENDEDEDEEESNGEEEVDDEIEKLSNEELNKKFEDFIRRMKEEFKINQYQHQQLVLVK